jgi:hypothetical protein
MLKSLPRETVQNVFTLGISIELLIYAGAQARPSCLAHTVVQEGNRSVDLHKHTRRETIMQPKKNLAEHA